MLATFNQNYKKNLQKLSPLFNKSIIKTGLFLGLFAYWGFILIGTVLQLN